MSTQDNIRESMQGVIEHYTQNPEKALGPDSEAIAVIEEGLRVRASGPNGQSLVCDMPKGLGGGATAPSPGWTMRATLANCETIMIALRAAQLGIELKTLEVHVNSISDDRGMLGIDDTKPAGPGSCPSNACNNGVGDAGFNVDLTIADSDGNGLYVIGENVTVSAASTTNPGVVPATST